MRCTALSQVNLPSGLRPTRGRAGRPEDAYVRMPTLSTQQLHMGPIGLTCRSPLGSVRLHAVEQYVDPARSYFTVPVVIYYPTLYRIPCCGS